MRENQSQTQEFKAGTPVMYGLHGKCQVVGIEERRIGSETLHFYKLEPIRSSNSRSARKDPAIWVPVQAAQQQGLREPLHKDDVDSVLKALQSREYYFPIQLPWIQASAQIDAVIRQEGAIGLTKAVSYLHVLRKRHVVAPSEVEKLYEATLKLLLRELADATGQTPKEWEPKVLKLLNVKLAADH